MADSCSGATNLREASHVDSQVYDCKDAHPLDSSQLSRLLVFLLPPYPSEQLERDSGIKSLRLTIHWYRTPVCFPQRLGLTGRGLWFVAPCPTIHTRCTTNVYSNDSSTIFISTPFQSLRFPLAWKTFNLMPNPGHNLGLQGHASIVRRPRPDVFVKMVDLSVTGDWRAFIEEHKRT